MQGEQEQDIENPEVVEAAAEVEATQQEADERAEFSEVELLAMDMGWKPESQYKGDKSKWRGAKDYIKAERDISRHLKDEVKSLRDTVDRVARTSASMTERALKQQAEEINARFEQAVEDGDKAAAAKAAREMRDLEGQAVSPKSSEADFASRNTWYGKDEDATAYAISVSQREAAKGKSEAEQLAEVEKAVKKRFPELFGQEEEPRPRKDPPAVNRPNGRGTMAMKRELGFADMPAAAKQAAEDYAKLFKDRHGIDPAKSKAEYARDYWADQAA